jgi:thioesterase domain-containing protein
VPIQTEGARPPFFCVHGMSGNVLNFRDLARRLGPDQPFFGLQALGLNGRDQPHTSIEDMASHYIAEVQRVDPDGPYYLGGFSGGGTVAFEMARQLRGLGKEVRLVVFLDTWSPAYVYKSPLRRVAGVFHGILHGGASFLGRWMYRKARRAWFGGRRFLIDHGLIRRDLRRRYLERMRQESLAATVSFDLGANHLAAERKYRLRPLKQRAIMLRAVWRGEDGFVPRDFGWTPYVDSLSIFDVPGGHEEMFYEPYVRIMAQRLRTEMDRCIAERGTD